MRFYTETRPPGWNSERCQAATPFTGQRQQQIVTIQEVVNALEDLLQEHEV